MKLGKGLLFVIILIGSVILFRIFASALDASLSSVFHNRIPSGSEYKTKEDCEKNKGDWGRAGLFPREFCRMPTSDFGKKCIAGFQCQTGMCVAKFEFRNNPVLAVGQCPKYVQIFGCTQEVHFGFTSRGICRD
jgi:hypothetical protein